MCRGNNCEVFHASCRPFKVFLSFLCVLIKTVFLNGATGVTGKVGRSRGRFGALSCLSNIKENEWRRAAETREEGK